MKTGTGQCICGQNPKETSARKTHAVTLEHIKFVHENGGKQLIFDTFRRLGSRKEKSRLCSKVEKRYDISYKKFYGKKAEPFVRLNR